MKSVGNPTTADAIQRMRQAIDKLALAAGNERMILHIVAPNDNFATMRTALLNHVEGKPYESRITILTEMLTYP